MLLRIPLFLSLLFFPIVNAEIRSFSGVIEAASSYIHYSEGYLVAPGYVDISNLKFSTLLYVEDAEVDVVGKDDDDIGNDDGEEPAPEDGGDGGDRVLDEAAEGSDGSVVRSDTRFGHNCARMNSCSLIFNSEMLSFVGGYCSVS